MGSRIVHERNKEKYLQCREMRTKGINCGQISQELGIPDHTIRRWSDDVAPRRFIHPLYRVDKIDHSYFSAQNLIQHPERLVLVGFIAADGCISDRHKTPYLTFNISEKDQCSLEVINRCICDSSRRLSIIQKTRSIILSIPSPQIAADLAQFGIVPRKTATIGLPTLSGKSMQYFIRGYFYGDGCVYQPKQHSARMYHLVGNQIFINGLRAYLLDNGIIERCGVYQIKNSQYLQMHVKGSQATPFGKYVFNDDRMVLLRRKHILL